MNHELYLSVTKAAQYLDVSTNTLYAYVSRKGIRIVKDKNSKSSKYWAEDIYSIKNERYGKTNESNNLKNLTYNSEITLITADSLYYRGHDVIQLAEKNTVEEVAELLWNKPGVFGAEVLNTPARLGEALSLYTNAAIAERAIAIFPILADKLHEQWCHDAEYLPQKSHIDAANQA
ncbi:MAG: hypothetical protein HRT51_16100 [Colwellia sp.]|nr:hypothetical protein [Colwellia sp.]